MGVQDIGWAVKQMLHGSKVRREAWRDGNWLVYQKGYPDGIAINKNTAEATGIPEGTICRFQPYIMAHTPDGSFAPWTPWTPDLLGSDWKLAA